MKVPPRQQTSTISMLFTPRTIEPLHVGSESVLCAFPVGATLLVVHVRSSQHRTCAERRLVHFPRNHCQSPEAMTSSTPCITKKPSNKYT